MHSTHPWGYSTTHPDKLAVVMAESEERCTYRELAESSNRYARALRAMGLKAGDTLSILMENRPEYLALCWAAKNTGLYYVCISTHLVAAEAAYIVRNSGSRLLIGSRSTQDIAARVRDELGTDCCFVLLDVSTLAEPGLEILSREMSSAIIENPRRGASMLYSSGTTGRPKGIRVPLTDVTPDVPPVRHAMLVAAFGFTEATVFMNPGPLYHAGPLRFAMAVHREGGTVVLNRRFDAVSVLCAMRTLQITHALFVPTMFVRMLRLGDDVRSQFTFPSLQCAVHAAAPCPVLIKEKMLDWWGPVIFELYGGTEGSGTTVIGAREWLTHKGSVGLPLPGCEAHIVNDAGEEVPANVQGRIFFKSPRTFEYFNDPERTAAVRHIRGWTTMGDIGYVDDEGYLYLTDRQADMIISGGVNIYPQEAENILQSHPHVADVAVIGVPDEDYGEQVRAIVQPEAGVEASPEFARELMSFCRARLSSIKCPRGVDFVDRLPREENGKLYKRLIKDAYWKGHSTRII
jgi:long-chain acyl-CoA synthetase